MKKFFYFIIAVTVLTGVSNSYAKSSNKSQHHLGCSQYDTSWELVDDYNHPGADGNPTLTYPVGIYVSQIPAGKVYVVGVSIDSSGPQSVIKNIIRRSVNFGGNWSTSDFTYTSQTGSTGIHIVEAPRFHRLLFLAENHIYASHSLANTFVEIADLSTQFPQYSNILALDTVNVGNKIYLVANAKSTINGHTNWRGLVFSSSDNGANWTLEKEFNYGDANRTWLTSITADSQGHVVVGGYVQNGGSYYWVVSKSNSTLSSWEDLETQLPPGQFISYVRALVVNDNDEVLALGPLTLNSSNSTYIRKYTSSSETTVYQSAPGLQGTDLIKVEDGKILFPFTEGGFSKVALSDDDGNTWNDSWSTVDVSTYSYEMGEDRKNNLYLTTQFTNRIKTYKLSCEKMCH